MFSINSYYEKLLTREEVASLYMSNFVAENLRREITYVGWWYICKVRGEDMDHVLLHCMVVLLMVENSVMVWCIGIVKEMFNWDYGRWRGASLALM